MINNYIESSEKLNQMLRQHVNVFHDPKFNQVSDDEKLMVATVLLDYLQPMLDDPYVFEVHFFDLILNLHKAKTGQVLFKAIELIYYDLR